MYKIRLHLLKGGSERESEEANSIKLLACRVCVCVIQLPVQSLLIIKLCTFISDYIRQQKVYVELKKQLRRRTKKKKKKQNAKERS